VSKVIYPLRFFTRLPPVAQALQNIPDSATIDATSPPNAYLLPICPVCNTGEGIVREENDDMQRYRCVVCNRSTPYKATIEEAGEAWSASLISEVTPETTN